MQTHFVTFSDIQKCICFLTFIYTYIYIHVKKNKNLTETQGLIYKRDLIYMIVNYISGLYINCVRSPIG